MKVGKRAKTGYPPSSSILVSLPSRQLSRSNSLRNACYACGLIAVNLLPPNLRLFPVISSRLLNSSAWYCILVTFNVSLKGSTKFVSIVLKFFQTVV